MSLDEYILGLLGIISGLAISGMVGGLHLLLAHRRRVKWHWLTPLAALYVAYLILSSWWVSWLSFHGRTQSVTLGLFLLPIIQLVSLFLAARGVLPDELPSEEHKPLDLEKFYFNSKRYVWGAVAMNSVFMLVAISIWRGDGSTATRGMGVTLPVLLFGLAYYVALALINYRWFHRIAVPLALVIIVSLTVRTVITN